MADHAKVPTENPAPAAHSRVFGSGFDLWVPALLVCAMLAGIGGILQESLLAFSSIIVFLLGILPQAKMKRADLLVTLQERFSELQSDPRALGIGADAEASGTDDERKEAYAFYLRFWNLQILEFGLWRYGMIPSDTYAHWIVRRLLSFSPENEEEYFHTRPLRGWTRVKREFVGTDFHAFMDAAFEIGTRVRRQRGAMKATQGDYDALHDQIERLLVHSGGGRLWSTFVVRWFSPRRPSLRTRDAAKWADLATKRLLRESPTWTGFFVISAFLSIPLSWIAGVAMANLIRSSAEAASTRVTPGGSTVIFEPEPPRSRYIVRFADEGGCLPGKDPRAWHGAMPSGWNRAVTSEVSRDLAACSTAEHRVRIEVVGFASSSEFKELADCGPGISSSAEANLRLANARAENVKALLDRRLRNGEVSVRPWGDYMDMEDERGFVDTLSIGVYDPERGPLNRRVEIRVLDAGACE